MIRQALQGAAGKVSRTTTIDCWVSLTSFVSFLVQKVRYQSVGCRERLHCSDPHRVGNFRVKHLNLDIEWTRRVVILVVLLIILLVIILLYHFLVKKTVNSPIFRIKIVIF